MKPRVCIGCGEAISEKGNALSRNPNLCTSCSSLADSLEESEAPEAVRPELDQLPADEKPSEYRKAA